MNKKNIFILVGVVVLIVVLVILGTRLGGEKAGEEGEGVSGEDAFRPDNPEALSTVEGGTREVVQEKIATPELGATDVPEGVAVPTNVSQLSGPGGEAGLRDFEIRAENGKFSPNTIVVNDGDIINVIVTAVDGDYNFFFPDFGVYQFVKAGTTAKRQFQATPFGQYEFYCKDCGNDARGTLIVNEK
ncbi:MAG: cupredoxin domain-containing protein [Candidatus Jorgensenbacteria bacterium]